ncbi:type I polyketide synthase [Nocardia blacklockiae]|uniref:type I polyketide synthase n=1 Tax=Nocardia blacklockiae TaxID=480036 RepID=UPI00189550D2|nr:type I polyketide synthase [Nocardia blacklockiae]MBF6169901.1 SDR family NAD(P)-dependent oxidoreductase [Nocardia blacklockiae]
MSNDDAPTTATLVDTIRHRADRTPDRLAMRFVRPTAAARFDAEDLTYQDVDTIARAVAVTLAAECAPGARVLLLCPPGLEYTMYFYGCLYAGLIPVPAYPPASNRHLSRVETIARSARASAVLTAEGADRFDMASIRGNEIPTLSGVTWLEASRSAFDNSPESWRPPAIDGDTTALLQYTSGSTSAPKGVVVSHANLLNNARLAAGAFEVTEETVGAGWLPPYHDMGLLGGLVSPIYSGIPVVVISPMTFIRDPLYWLEVISRERATSSAGPNFAYQMCVDRADPERLADIDLSSWKYALNGSEPVRAEVLDRFAETFRECGFRRSSFYPCYGLAEATLLVSGARTTPDPVIAEVSGDRLEQGCLDAEGEGRRLRLVGSGRVAEDTEVVIVDPATHSVLPDGRVGEVWIRGISVAAGYFENETATAETFDCYTDTGAGPYLNPGDLGCLVDGELFIVGRSKEAMNFRGRNVYPQDVEATSVHSHPGLAGTRCVAFSIEVDGADELVVVQQKPRRASKSHSDAEIVKAIRRAVSEEFQLSAYDVLLVPARAIPVTSSGKLQRGECRMRYLDGEYGGRAAAAEPVPAVESVPAAEPVATQQIPTPSGLGRQEVEDLLVELICLHSGLPPADIDRQEQFASYGLSSIQAVRIAAELSERLGVEIPPTLAWEYPSIAAAAAALAEDGADIVVAADRPAAVFDEPIAVVGIGCRLPGAVTGPDEFWDLLVAGRSGIETVPADRWSADEFYDADPDAPGRTYSRHGGFLSDVRGFDAAVFGISAREAISMDPQHRLMLEVAWEALEHAGIAPDSLRGSATGVFVGMSGGDYERLAAAAHGTAAIDAYVATGNAGNFGANRLSYALGLEGPSLVVDTACSSSLVALHLAAQSLRSGESSLALVGGVNLLLSPEVTVALSKGRMLSATGQCRTFDADADGYVRGEGCGVVVLRRLSDAVAAGDRILGVVHGSAVNQDGRSSGLTAPSAAAQQAVVRQALAAAGMRPEQVGYVEAHGTGTPLGDPIEVRALAAVLGAGRAGTPVRLGSVKTNIGHLEAAAGIAGFIKAVLMVSRAMIPPHLNIRELTPHIAWDRVPFEIPRAVTAWSEDSRVAGVSSFGFGGTNAHVILGAPPAPAQVGEPSGDGSAPVVVKVSGADPAGAAAAAGRLSEFVAADPRLRPEQIAWAANVGRADQPYRASVVAESRGELLSGLRELADGNGIRQRRAGAAPRVAFLAPGHGARIAGALAGIYGTVPVVTEVIDGLGSAARLPLSVLVDGSPAAEAELSRTEVAQPALYALAVALGAWWRSVGVEPAVIAGHSVGAYAAAALAGVFSVADGAELIRVRAQAMSRLDTDAAMAAIGCGAAELEALPQLRSGEVTVAVLNSASDTVVAGPAAPVDALIAAMTERGVKAKRLPVTQAFHSPAVDPVLDTLRAVFEQVELSVPATDFLSDTTGAQVTGELADPDYWVAHTRRPVRFGDTVTALLERGVGVVLELGPGALLPLVMNHPGAAETLCVASVTTARPARTLAEALTRLWQRGSDINWAATQPRPHRVPELPTYPFQHTPYWITDEPPRAQPGSRRPAALPAAPRTVSAATGFATATRTVEEEVEALQREIARLLELPAADRIDPDTGLFELGLTSAMAVELITRLRETHTVPLPPTVVFEHPTIARLAEYLSRGGAEQITAARRVAETAEPIAIVGMACRFPGGADDLGSYWDLLVNGRDGTGPVPPGRESLILDELREFRGGFLAGPVAEFDAEAFGIAPREARAMDPQQRLLLEVVWEALDDAGIPRDGLDGTAGSVHIGMNTTDYLQLLAAGGTSPLDPYFATGNTFSVAAGRVSYLLGLRGPSVAVDTACSSSLVATDHALRDLRSGVSDIALVGGVNLMMSPATILSLSSMGALATDGRCKTFDSAADGYGRGEGCGVLVLKRLSDAERDGDRIWALIRGSAVNQDGRSAGLTVPSGTAQAAVIAEALQAAGVEAQSMGYVEAHGTGTPLGDPIELSSLVSVLRPDTAATDPLIVGSAKTNVGHLEAAAGVCGLIKVALALHHRTIPPHLHYATPNPRIPWADTPVVVPTAALDWPDHGAGRLGGVSSFGFSGTNAHVILQEAPEVAAAEPDSAEGPRLVTVSGASPEAVRDNAAALAALVETDERVTVRDIAATLARHRTLQPYRHSLVAGSRAELAAALERLADETTPVRRAAARTRSGLVFVYSGQGGQWVGLGRALLAEPLLRDSLTECDRVVRATAGWSLIAELERAEGDSRLDDTRYAQPVICAVQIALTDLWARWGIRPGTVVGHSVGEIAAAYAAGTLTREDALRLAVRRGAAMAGARGRGAMAAIGLPETRVRELVDRYRAAHGDGDGLCLAALNGPAAVVIAGGREAVAAVVDSARTEGARTQLVQQEYAFHSAQVDSARTVVAEYLEHVELRSPSIRFVSTVTGALAADEPTGPGYWADAVVRPVLFESAVRAAVASGAHAMVEIGPDRTLAGAVLQTLGETPLPYLPSMVRDRPVLDTVLAAAGGLLDEGYALSLPALHPDGTYHRVPLPAYRWQRQEHWLPGRPQRPATTPEPVGDLYDIDWRTSEPDAAPAAHTGDWIVVAEESDLAREITTRLHARGGNARTVTPAFVRTADPEAWRELLATLPAAPESQGGTAADGPGGAAPGEAVGANASGAGDAALRGAVGAADGDAGAGGAVGATPGGANGTNAGAGLGGDINVLHLATADGVVPQADRVAGVREPDRVAAAIDAAAGVLLGVVQSWIGAGRGGRVFTVTRGAVPVGEERLALEQAPLWGLGRVIGLEHPGLWGGTIDLDPAGTEPGREAEAIVARITSADDEDQIAFRGPDRLVPRLRTVDDIPSATADLDPAAAYLITGGRGSLGLRLAAWLARRGARHLILLGRTPLEQAPEATREALAALRKSGVTVYAPDVDVADHAGMTELFEGPSAAWPEIRGVIHAAGALDAAAVADMTMAQFIRVLRGKVRGGLVLDALPALARVDFFVLFSSAAAVWGSALAGHYCAANHFLDMLAWDRRARGLPALALDWGWWQDSAMAAGHGDYFAAMGMAELPADTALAVLDATLGAARTQLVAAPVDWRRFVPVMEAKRRRPLLADMARTTEPTDHAAAERFLARLRALPAAGRERVVQDAVQREVAAVLGRPERSRLDPRQGFFESGLDSITSVELKGRLDALVGRSIPVTTIFEHPTVADLSTHLLDVLDLTDTETSTETGENPPPDTETDLLELTEIELLQLLDQELNTGRIDDQH